MESKLIQYKNKNIFYSITGKGRPVVLLHGFGEDGNIWNTLAENLHQEFKCVIPDLPGSGKSDWLTGDNISLEDYADGIKCILDREDIAETTMIGHSMGGYITLAFAEKYPQLLKGFGLFHSSAFADDDDKKETRVKTITFIKEKGVPQYLKTSFPNLFADKGHPAIEKLIEAGKTISSETLIQYLQAMIKRPDRTNFLQSYKKPVLFIIGEKDAAVPLQTSLQQCHLPPIAFVNILKNVGHMGMVEAEIESGNAVLNFLQNI